jgi:hypothetical protein
MSLVSRIGMTLAALGVAGAALPAFAGDFGTVDTAAYYSNAATFETTTDANSPTFDRPLINLGDITTSFSGLSGAQTHVGYAATDFTAASTGQYRVTTLVESGFPTNVDGTSNFVQFVYARPFDATKPLNNIQAAYNPKTNSGSYGLSLSNGDALTFINGGRYNNDNPAGNKYSLGTVKTTIDEYNAGTTQIIPQADVLGNTGVASETLTLVGTDTITSFNSFSFDGLAQSSIGDLTATLTHDGVTVTLFDQPDTANFGSLASFDSSQTYKFADSGTNLETAAQDTVNAGDPTAAAYPLAGGTYKSLDGLSAFKGLGLAGAWTLSLISNQPSSTGSFLGFSFNADTEPAAVPEASTAVPFGVGCFLFGVLIWKRRTARVSSTKVS